MWINAENGDSTKPSTIDSTSSSTHVYVRKDFEEVPTYDQDGEQIGTHWKYKEQCIPKEDWEIYQTAMQNTADINDLTDAVIELAGILGGE